MITGKETNFVYLSELLITDTRFSNCCKRLLNILDENSIRYQFLVETKDIWCRDYMPIQIEIDSFVQFIYDPKYLKDFPELKSEPKVINKKNKINPVYKKIRLDGGNLVCWSDRVIISERVFDDNPEIRKMMLIDEIEKVLCAEVIIIPDIKSDLTGHADGYVRFVNRNTLIGNDLDSEYKYWRTRMKNILNEYNFLYIDLPVSAPDLFLSGQNKSLSAVGCYTNFLEVGNLILMPVFETKNNKDSVAYDIIESTYRDRVIRTININEIAVWGGLLNCISWTVKRNKVLL